MNKPVILIISINDGQNAYLTKALQELTDEFDVIYFEADTFTSPFIRSEEILHELQKKHITPHGVFGFLDNEVSIAAIIAEKLGIPGPSLTAIYKAQNKEVFAKLLRKHQLPFPKTRTIHVIQKRIPMFHYPVFIRPVKGSFSADSYMITSEDELKKTMHFLSGKKNIVAPSYKLLFQDFDTRYRELDYLFIVQEFINAKQYNADGFVHNGKIYLLGITESIYTPDRKSFKRFDFPHRLPDRIFKKLKHILQKIVTLLSYSDSGFNVEFFITPDKKIIIIEFNARLSRQFFPLFEQVYMQKPLTMLSNVALGKMPSLTKKTGKVQTSSIPLRVFYNAKVLRVPTEEEIRKLEKTLGILSINIYVKEGSLLSDYRQDAYSYRYGVVDITGKNLREILTKERKLMKKLPVKFEKVSKKD